MCKGFAEGVGVVPEVAVEGVDYGITLGLEEEQIAVVGHCLCEGCGTTIGRYTKQLDRGLYRRIDVLALLLAFVACILLAVLLFGFEPVVKLGFVDGLDE